MIVTVALRSLTARPIRSIVLAVGFGLGVGVMVTLLGVGDVILLQARAPALSGGGDVAIGSASGRLGSARFVLYSLRPRRPLRRSASARTGGARHDVPASRRPAVPVALRGGIPCLKRALGDRETAGVSAWTDAPGGPCVAGAPIRARCCARSIDSTRSRTSPRVRASWAEWLYFNGIGERQPLLPDVHRRPASVAGASERRCPAAARTRRGH